MRKSLKDSSSEEKIGAVDKRAKKQQRKAKEESQERSNNAFLRKKNKRKENEGGETESLWKKRKVNKHTAKYKGNEDFDKKSSSKREYEDYYSDQEEPRFQRKIAKGVPAEQIQEEELEISSDEEVVDDWQYEEEEEEWIETPVKVLPAKNSTLKKEESSEEDSEDYDEDEDKDEDAGSTYPSAEVVSDKKAQINRDRNEIKGKANEPTLNLDQTFSQIGNALINELNQLKAKQKEQETEIKELKAKQQEQDTEIHRLKATVGKHHDFYKLYYEEN